jgi:hypothetical protein
VSIDEMARTAARRTSTAVAAASDTDTAYGDLVAVHRRRARAKVVAVSASLLAALLVVVVGAAERPNRRIEPIAPVTPKPTSTKAFLAAPPFCGPTPLGDSLEKYVDVGGECPTGPGRYLTISMGYGTSPPFAFTLPKDWTIQEIGAMGGGGVMPALGGLLLRSNVTGHALVLAEYPTEVLDSGRLSNTEGASIEGIVTRLAERSFVQPTTPFGLKVDGEDAWRVNLVARPDAAYGGHCLIGDRCAVTFALGRDPYPGRSYAGLVPGLPSTAIVIDGTTHIVTMVWTWGDPDVDPDLSGILTSIDLHPNVLCRLQVEPCAAP